tara:strand:+ start:234 stop:362 length:129 start_codon:yes stop_codon:yes gene_type:complete
LWNIFPIKIAIFDKNKLLIAKKTEYEDLFLKSSVFTHCFLKI